MDGSVITFPISPAPVDPWSGVAGNRPAIYAGEGTQWLMREEPIECTAARDHCLPALAWMWAHQDTRQQPIGNALPVVFGSTGLLPSARASHEDHDRYVAYRTVPATVQNLKVGTRVVAFPDKPLPPMITSTYDTWRVGTVERVDWDLGFVYLTSSDAPFFITATRVAVAIYAPSTGISKL